MTMALRAKVFVHVIAYWEAAGRNDGLEGTAGEVRSKGIDGGSTNLTDVISARCAAAGIPPPHKVDDETMKLLLELVCDRAGISHRSSNFDVIASTFIEMYPECNQSHFNEFLEIGCEETFKSAADADNMDEASAMKIATDEGVQRSFESCLIKDGMHGQ
ncbi:hypothetical protein LY76DRAFT_603530 [Colletotrichum caudatum]|nr:hypothetical protein LY76DRAFT_603530 [Colletotrichum caudatum]